jgi:hypothetical protein
VYSVNSISIIIILYGIIGDIGYSDIVLEELSNMCARGSSSSVNMYIATSIAVLYILSVIYFKVGQQ